jgi:hypothetical protein
MVAKLLKLIIPVLIIIAGALYFFVFTGTIVVDSRRPPTATVEIDGVAVGTTPVRKRVRAGVRQIAVYKEGFETWHGEQKIRGTSPSTVSVRLRFLLRSDPNGAEITMDGKYIGLTNLALDLRPGMHTFEFRKDGYQTARFRANIPVVTGQPVPLVTLTPAKAPPPEERWPVQEPSPPEYGVIQVTSIPDAQVYLDGEWQGETPLTINKVLVGDYVITLSKDGYRDIRKTVYVKKDQTEKIAGKLKPEPTDE